MSLDKRICKECGKEFVLTPDKPGYANVCRNCSTPPPKPTNPQLKAHIREIFAEEFRRRGKPEVEVEKIIEFMAEQPSSFYVELVKRINQHNPN